MSSMFAWFMDRRGRFLLAAILLVLQFTVIFALPALAGARPFLSTASLALPSAVVLLRPSRLSNLFTGFSFHRDDVLGTSFDLYVSTKSAELAHRCESLILREIERLERILSMRDPKSEINRSKDGAGLECASPELKAVLDLCEQWRERTDGAFDARLGALVTLWNEADRHGRLPEKAAITDLLGRLAEQPWNVDALGKSFILDHAARQAQLQTGVRGLLLDIGGDMIALGDGNGLDGHGWEVGVTHPERPHDNAMLLTRLALRNQAVTTSAAYARQRTIEGKSYSHILDPRTGQPATGIASATVVAPDAATANALATSLCVLNPSAGLRLVERVADTSCFIVAADGAEHRSAGLLERPVEQDSFADAWPENHQVTLSLKLLAPTNGGRKTKRPYVAVWLEDADGKPVRTLAVWGNHPKYLRDLFDWWKWASKDNDLVKAVTKASRAPGAYSLVWDGKDDKGKILPTGTYTIQVEVHREHGKHIRQTGKIECGMDKASVTLDATDETGETKAEYGPRGK